MRILTLADIYDIHWREKPGQVDLIISCGDVDDNLLEEAMDAMQCRRAFAVRGNHDRDIPLAPNVVDLHLTPVEVDGIVFGGFQGSWKYKPRGHYLYEQEEVREALRAMPGVEVFVAHNSPRGVHDKEDEIHSGFEALNEYLRQQQPHILFHGHQHVRRQTMVDRTLVAGVYGAQAFDLRRCSLAGNRLELCSPGNA